MDKRRRRRRSLGIFVAVGVVVAGVIVVTAFVGRPEAVARYRAVALLAADGTAQVHESILYRFPQDRHGIYRVLPDVPLTAAGSVRVASDNTDAFTVLPDGAGIRLKIGDPDETISGEHRYDIAYPLSTVDLGGGRFGWNGVGASWDVPVEHSELDLVAPWRWEGAVCDAGESGAVGDCTVTQPVPGRLEVSHGRLASGEGITVYAQRGTALAATPSAREVPMDSASLAWTQQPFVLGAVGGLLLIVGAVAVGAVFRRAGRDLVMAGPASTGAAADLAYGPTPQVPPPPGATLPAGVRRVDDTELAGWATTAFAPPEGLRAWQGGVVATEAPRTGAQVAWLLDAAVAGAVTIDESDPSAPVLRRGAAATDPETAVLLEVALAGRDAVTLGSYDPSFTSMWTSLPSRMKGWFKASGFSDPAGERRASAALVAGGLGVIVAAIVLFFSAKGSSAHPVGGLVVVAVAAGGFGAAFGALIRAWELHVRTPAGSAMWLRVESFRRFIAASEAEHVRQAAERGVLREYTAWAIALDEVDHWTAAVSAAGLPPTTPGLSTALAASTISSSMSSAGTAPSSSGGGGGVGGGGGGGGGGSW